MYKTLCLSVQKKTECVFVTYVIIIDIFASFKTRSLGYNVKLRFHIYWGGAYSAAFLYNLLQKMYTQK